MTDNSSKLPPRREAVRLKNARKLSTSSQRWLQRQLNDPYVTAAKVHGWRSRAAFKLIELDEKYKLIGKNPRVLDLGAAPGGWSQVALARGASKLVGIDLLEIQPVSGADFIKGDFLEEGMEARLTEMLGGKADLVLSDMAPNTSGHVATDHLRIMALAEAALAFACDVLAPGGGFVAKLFQGGAEKEMLMTLKRRFSNVKHAKPPASRKESKEMYVVATGFRPD
ncbi:RlmE family RNA methyltransferase [Acidocella aminolytica]|jgi:23S rRNA (uridine2552-2'-O)-methyltransferase|uniref:Ribosomal RNA large subunit methyltransferase E n=1 Tax=Acidocella aminolytica 101 = DSM 11237 TaxID=1120923 RepID=A0A0D6PJ39_9PROT|nr:RlmE family RNA methyltransferase [Acidocella aminolytica]GAN81682.1 ribosomal RNA large subunit 23S methyltransferase RrmJ/FtsJ [Acidocella aminolytica 101 = DSM 11237]GBQ32926.1 ribosomal RNA large subunit 23S methyltransferase RrmJ/FtsJ [Acidocella aminolytica 101 = DSM 11237]SHE50603.1 23S rRNA Um-2552 2'-O-methyltransferase [Acidocella aminolytica 101 = DSM 11237]